MSAAKPHARGGRRHERRRTAARIGHASSKSVVLAVPRDAVERGDTAQHAATLEAMLETPETVRRFRGQLFVHVTGYESDPRELHQIPEARSYLARLDEDFPYFFWFLNSDEPSFLITLLMCLVEKSGGDASGDVFDTHSLLAFMRRHYEALDELGALYRLKPGEVSARQEAVGAYFTKYEEAAALATAEPETPKPHPNARTIKLALVCAGAALTILAWALALSGRGTNTPLNVAGPIVAGLGAGYLLVPDEELAAGRDYSTASKFKLIAAMVVGTLAGILSDLLLRHL